MPRTIRYHLDEHVDKAIAKGLRLRGIDVTRTHEVGLRGAADEDHLIFALAEKRCIATDDDDFLSKAATGQRHFGIVVYQRRKRTVGQVISFLELLWDIYESHELRNRVEYL